MKIDVRRNILEANKELSSRNSEFFREKRVLAVNIMAAPGAGKTSTILKTIDSLREKMKFIVVEGDIASSIDTDKIQKRGVPAVQINTGHMCHLDANMIKGVVDKFDYEQNTILFIENVGNLVCPADFSLGEDLNIVIASVPEGDDKPFKYPAIFLKADAVILNKIDTLDAIDFDKDFFYEGLSVLKNSFPVFEVSCKTGEGFDAWGDWLMTRFEEKFPGSGSAK
jgi:hydrogenase nickel incorporation protein HypB